MSINVDAIIILLAKKLMKKKPLNFKLGYLISTYGTKFLIFIKLVNFYLFCTYKYTHIT